jgi:dihydroorotase
MAKILIENGRIVDPSQGIDRVATLSIADGKIVGIDVAANGYDTVINATDKIVTPGLIDLNVELQEPGWEEDETIETGTAAAIAGGFTSIACAPNTDPPIETQAGVEFVKHQADRVKNCNVFVLACVSKGREGEQLAEIGTLVSAGAVGFCDARRPIQNAGLLRRALQYCLMFDKPILNHPQATPLVGEGVMHEGELSMILGLKGMPVEAEDINTARDVRLTEATGGRIHLQSLSSVGSLEVIRRAKARGVRVTAEVCPHNIALTDQEMRRFDSNFKTYPPLRSQDHVDACIAALADGTIDVIASGHSPRASEKKMRELDQAPFGIVALETALSIVVGELIDPGHLTWRQAVEKMSLNPAKVLGIDKGTLKPGADADVTIIDANATWTADPSRYRSKSRNCPYAGRELKGKAVQVIVNGECKL